MISNNKLIKHIKCGDILRSFKLACDNLNYNLAKYLLLIRNDPNINNSNKFIYNIKNNNHKTIVHLIDNEYDYLDLNHFFVFACQNNFINILNWIIDGNDLTIDYEFGLCCACLYGNFNIVQKLHHKYPLLNLNAYYDAPYSLACLNGNIDIINYICMNTFFINYYSFNNEVFYNACINNKIEIVNWYCQFHLSNDIIINGSKHACKNNNIDILKLLINFNIFYGSFNDDIVMLIKYACHNKNYDIISWLLRFRPNIDAYDKMILLRILCENGCFKILKLLMKYYYFDLSIDDELPFRIANLFEKMKMVKFLLKCKPNINIGIYDNIIFKMSCIGHKMKSVKYLISLNEKKYYAKISNNKVIDYKVIYDKNFVENDIINCLVCYDEKSTLITSCNHQYCKTCIFTWTLNNKTCPYCRTYIDKYYNLIV